MEKNFLFVCRTGPTTVRHSILAEDAPSASAKHEKGFPTHEFVSAWAFGHQKKRKVVKA